MFYPVKIICYFAIASAVGFQYSACLSLTQEEYNIITNRPMRLVCNIESPITTQVTISSPDFVAAVTCTGTSVSPPTPASCTSFGVYIGSINETANTVTVTINNLTPNLIGTWKCTHESTDATFNFSNPVPCLTTEKLNSSSFAGNKIRNTAPLILYAIYSCINVDVTFKWIVTAGTSHEFTSTSVSKNSTTCNDTDTCTDVNAFTQTISSDSIFQFARSKGLQGLYELSVEVHYENEITALKSKSVGNFVFCEKLISSAFAGNKTRNTAPISLYAIYSWINVDVTFKWILTAGTSHEFTSTSVSKESTTWNDSDICTDLNAYTQTISSDSIFQFAKSEGLQGLYELSVEVHYENEITALQSQSIGNFMFYIMEDRTDFLINNPQTKAIIIGHCMVLLLLVAFVITFMVFRMRKGTMKKRGFSFVLSPQGNEADQFKVTVNPADRLDSTNNLYKRHFHRPSLGNYRRAKKCMQRIHTIDELFRKATIKITQSETLDPDTICFTDCRSASEWPNIRFSFGNKKADVHVAELHFQPGANMCFAAGYQDKLLGFIKHGIMKSLKDNTVYEIPVIIQKRKKNEHWSKVQHSEFSKIRIEEILRTRDKLQEKQLQIARNLFKISQKTNMIEHLETAIVNQIVKKGLLCNAAEKIPIISTMFGLYFGAVQAKDGNWKGALENIVSGVVADIPVVGTTLSVVVDISFLTLDLEDAVELSTNLEEQEINDLTKNNKVLIDDIEHYYPQSDNFGYISEGNMFDESVFAYTDDISKIHIKSNDSIVSIQMEYEFGGKKACHGGNGGTLKTMVLDSNEKITTVKVSTDGSAVCGLEFLTDMGREESFGNFRNDSKLYELFNGTYIGAIKGCELTGNTGAIKAIGFTAKF